MFSALKVRDFRLYWFGMLISLIGTWIQFVAQAWLVFMLTGSPVFLGLVGFFGTIPSFMLSLFGGVVADVVQKRKILIITQISFMVLALVLAVLTGTKFLNVWMIMIIALANGVVMAFDAPARHAMVWEVVGQEHVFNAVVLNAVSFNAARMIGPAIAGILIAAIGVAGCFYVNAASFLAVIFALLTMKDSDIVKKSDINNLWNGIIAGLKFLKDNKRIAVLISIVAVPSLFGMGHMVLMPIFAQDILGVGAKGMGFLMSSIGIGALVGGLILAKLGDYKHKGTLLIAASFVFSISLTVFALSKFFILSSVALIFFGWSMVACLSTINTIIQVSVPDEYRGRVMSVYMLTFAGFMPFGNFMMGWIAHFIGAPLAVSLGGLICFAFSLYILLKKRDLIGP